MVQRILQLPGWQGSDSVHWQSRWEALYGDERVEQADWNWPLRGDWMARLDEVIQSAAEDRGNERPAVILVAHSLGCQLVASWAAHSKHTHTIRAALLVAPPDTERVDSPPNLFSWRPITRSLLPFKATVVMSTDDPYCEPDKARQMAVEWGANLLSIGPHGHINSNSSLGDWPEGRQLLNGLCKPFGNPPSDNPSNRSHGS